MRTGRRFPQTCLPFHIDEMDDMFWKKVALLTCRSIKRHLEIGIPACRSIERHATMPIFKSRSIERHANMASCLQLMSCISLSRGVHKVYKI